MLKKIKKNWLGISAYQVPGQLLCLNYWNNFGKPELRKRNYVRCYGSLKKRSINKMEGMPRRRIVFRCLRNIRNTRESKPSLDFLKFLSANKTLQNPYKICSLKVDAIKCLCSLTVHHVCLAVLAFTLSGTQRVPLCACLWFQ